MSLILLRWGEKGADEKRSPVDEVKTAKGVPVSNSPIARIEPSIEDSGKKRGREGSESRGQDPRVADCWVEVK